MGPWLLLSWVVAQAAPVAGPKASPSPVASPSPSPVAAAITEDGRLTAVEFSIVLKVVHPTQARRDLVALAAARGGFPSLTSDEHLTLKVPPEALAELMPQLAAVGLTLDKSLKREDVTEAVAKLEGRVRSKGDILAQLKRFFGDSNVVATLQIEKSMTNLISELEQVKGELRVTRERARWAVVQVHFQYNEVGRTQYVRSPFEWLNTVELEAFMGRFESP